MEMKNVSEVSMKLYELRDKLIETGSLDTSDVNIVIQLDLIARYEYLLSLDEDLKNKWLGQIATAKGIFEDVALKTFDFEIRRGV